MAMPSFMHRDKGRGRIYGGGPSEVADLQSQQDFVQTSTWLALERAPPKANTATAANGDAFDHAQGQGPGLNLW